MCGISGISGMPHAQAAVLSLLLDDSQISIGWSMSSPGRTTTFSAMQASQLLAGHMAVSKVHALVCARSPFIELVVHGVCCFTMMAEAVIR